MDPEALWRPAEDPTGIPRSAMEFAAAARTWAFEGGAQVIGGCCRIGPETVRAVAEAFPRLPPPRGEEGGEGGQRPEDLPSPGTRR